jgi:ribosomal protein S18 acetylase RimI-like enzyme
MTDALRAMTDAEYAAWQAATVPDYAAEKVASGQWSAEESLARSAREFAELLPQGLATPDHHLFTLVDAQGAAVGSLWFAIKARPQGRIAYVFDIAVVPARRREGHARRAFVALEDEVQRRGLSGIALHVFGHNTGARALYDTLGYQPTNISLFKPVEPAAGVTPPATP